MDAAPAPPASETGKAAHVIAQLYYYGAALVGIGLVIGGTIAFLFGVRTLILPNEFEVARDGIRQLLVDLSFALPGLVTTVWHLRQARRREDRPLVPAFWGSALYFFGVELISLFFVIGGAIGILSSGAHAAAPTCFDEHALVPAGGPTECWPTPGGAARDAVDASIFVIAAGPVLWWHLRQGRRLTEPPRSGEGEVRSTAVDPGPSGREPR